MKVTIFSVVTVVVYALITGLARADVWSVAEKKIVRLQPNMFNDLPDEIVKELKAMKCTVPQTYLNNKPHNVISGSFADKTQTDWAVVCSVNGASMIKIFWGGAERCPSEISGSHDKNWLQGIGHGEIGYSRAIESVSKETIRKFHKAYGGPVPPVITHQGIDEYFVGKASVVHYCSDGRWIELTGAD